MVKKPQPEISKLNQTVMMRLSERCKVASGVTGVEGKKNDRLRLSMIGNICQSIV
jgi:hypothetical protein